MAEHWIDERTLDLTIDSPSLGTPAPDDVRLLLPPGWSKTASRTWPVLFLLHGGLGTYTSWSDPSEGNARAVIGDTGVITVLPGSGCGGGYVNWWNYGRYGTPAWDTYHVTELIQILERGYRAGTRRAVAGLSMGGFGAMGYATRHPGMFQGAASYSGFVHTLLDPRRTKDLSRQGGLLCQIDWRAASGDPTLPEERPLWAASNPYDHIGGLSPGQTVYLSAGDGQCGPLDRQLCLSLGPDPVEALSNAESRAFAQAAAAAGRPVTTHFYAGRHTWPYWRREFAASFPLLMNAIGATPAGG